MRDCLLKLTAIHSSPIGWEGEWEGQEFKRRPCRGSWALFCGQKVQAWGRGKTVLLLTSPTPASFCPRCQVTVPPAPITLSRTGPHHSSLTAWGPPLLECGWSKAGS